MNTLDTAKMLNIVDVSLLSAAAGNELRKAIEKHPLFADKLSCLDEEDVLSVLDAQRKANDSGLANASTIFHEEWYEFLEAVQNNDKAAARHELAQCIAMLLRIGIHLDDYMAKDKPG